MHKSTYLKFCNFFSQYSLLTTHYSLLITHYSLLSTYYSLVLNLKLGAIRFIHQLDTHFG